MKINFERTGGFMGMRLAISLDLDKLEQPDAEALQKLVDDSDLFNTPEPEAQPNLRDGFQYTLTVESESEQRILKLTDGSIPEELLPLINNLSLRARNKRS